MKKILLVLVALLVSSSIAMAGAFSPNYYTAKGEFSLTADAHYISGHDSTITEGFFTVGPAVLYYGLLQELMLSVKVEPREGSMGAFGSVGNAYNDGNPQVGLEYLLYNNPGSTVAVSIFGKYGFGLTTDESNTRYNRNDLSGGIRALGRVNAFSWSTTAGTYYAFSHKNIKDRADFFMDIDFMFRLNPRWALKGMFDYRLYGQQRVNRAKYDTIHRKVLTFGAVYNLRKNTDIMPYFAYQFKEDGARNRFSFGGAIGFVF